MDTAPGAADRTTAGHETPAELGIGEIARRSGLSPKALRLYDDAGLLVPRAVDQVTGYRTYGRDQVPRARLIARLRGVGMGLARIAQVCDLPAAAGAAELRSWWRQEIADATSRDRTVRVLLDELLARTEESTMTIHDRSTTIRRPRTATRLDIGQVREVQQDALSVRDLPGGRTLLGIADGFGPGTGIADAVLAVIARSVETALGAETGTGGAGGTPPLSVLEDAWTRAEQVLGSGGRRPSQVREDGTEDGSEDGTAGTIATGTGPAGTGPAGAGSMASPASGAPGTTVTVALLDEDHLAVAHVGDTRLLLIRDGRIEQVTHDHSHVRSLVDAGRLTAAEAAAHPDRAVLNRALAPGAPTAPDLVVRRVAAGDRLALLTDGVHAVVEAAALADALLAGEDAETAAERVLTLARDAGAPDNIGLVIADLPPGR